LRVPADPSLLSVLRDHGLALTAWCDPGVCSASERGYRDGVVIHLENVLPLSKRQDHLTLCVSRARAGVTLDI
jgi:hypothetical protein